MLDEMGIEDPFELTGLYDGTPLPEKLGEQVAWAGYDLAVFVVPFWTNGSRAATFRWAIWSRMSTCTNWRIISAGRIAIIAQVAPWMD